MAVSGIHQHKFVTTPILGLLNVPIKDLADLLGALLWDSLLVILIVDERNTETGLVALSPFKITVQKLVRVKPNIKRCRAKHTPEDSMPYTRAH